MKAGVSRGIVCAIMVGLLPACVSVPREDASAVEALQKAGLPQAELLLRQARRLNEDSDAAAVFRLRAAEIAWGELGGRRSGVVKNVETLPMEQQQALKILARSAEELAPVFVGKGREQERNFHYAGRSYRVEAARDANPGVLCSRAATLSATGS